MKTTDTRLQTLLTKYTAFQSLSQLRAMCVGQGYIPTIYTRDLNGRPHAEQAELVHALVTHGIPVWTGQALWPFRTPK